MMFILNALAYLCYGLILVNVLLSWVPDLRRQPFWALLYTSSETLLAPLRRVIRPLRLGNGVMLDLTPFIAYLLVQILHTVLANVLHIMKLA